MNEQKSLNPYIIVDKIRPLKGQDQYKYKADGNPVYLSETCSQCGALVGSLYPRHEKQTKKIRPKRPETDIKIILLIQHPYVLYIS